MSRVARWVMVMVVGMMVSGSVASFGAASDSERLPVLSLGMVLVAGSDSQARGLQPLVDYLEKKVGVQVKVRFFHDYYAVMNELDHETLDLAILTPLVYALCRGDPSLTYLATSLERGRTFYRSVLLARKDGPVRSLADVAGRRVAFVDQYSASGFVFPGLHLRRAGLIPDGLPAFSQQFAGSHDKAVRALLEGRADVAATFDSFFDYAGHRVAGRENVKLDDFRILAHVPERIPNDAIVCRTALPPAVKNRLRKALKTFSTDRLIPSSELGRSICSGFDPGLENRYDEVREFLGQAGVELPGPAKEN